MTWKMAIELYGPSFEGIKNIALNAFCTINNAQSLRDLSCISNDSLKYGYSIQVICPTRERITQLRKEADDLEKTLL